MRRKTPAMLLMLYIVPLQKHIPKVVSRNWLCNYEERVKDLSGQLHRVQKVTGAH